MKVEIVYNGDRMEVVHSLSVYHELYLCIIANPAREDSGKYLRAVELRREPIPLITTRMFKEVPFGYMCHREAVLLLKDADAWRLVHPLLLEPFPDELGVVDGEVYLRRRVGEKEFLYACTMKDVEGLGFPVIEEYTREVGREKEKFMLRDLMLQG
jgi:hypothetical protein